ncbi:RAMP superfamily CRISPR-associated protein [Desulfurobacterium atlanticum]|uniref:CRISPR/Cas system CMR subunit Cmr4, Cas7 group, RAMP superfamily n=1 Tax=Desulfurobacterium atlanticum TaxID=240169 RepID=A0A239A263_9BACT|nr:RAMP superfamily CRISPR-associated protein [Desulfurobacterium atlanticum]SNR89512.1 CRISPR/Cas system CMR subunit Cmr4, Cas7 group, RAMP superfamily [Desulfurobacterium atlanticum]
MKYDFYSFLKSERIDRISYNQFKNNQNLYFIHSKRDKLWGNKPGGNYSLYFKSKGFVYNFCPDEIWKRLNTLGNDTKLLKTLKFTLTLTSNLYTASENNFYSIDNQFAKEKATGLLVFKGSSLKGALRQAAVENLEDALLKGNYGEKFDEYMKESEETILEEEESNKDDRFFFKKRARLVKLFGNEKDINWFTFKSLLATGGIKDVGKIQAILGKISSAFEKYLKQKKVVNSEGICRGRLIFSDLHFTKVALDVITPLKRETRTPTSGPIYYEVVPAGENTTGAIIWFPFDLITKGKLDEIDEEWKADKKVVKKAFEKLKQTGIGAKTKDGWGRFEIHWEE